MKKEVKTNNKGFSLVELIVVVAIMAVLMVVLAPAMLRYVEKTRAGKDDTAVSEVREALQLALGEEEIYSDVNTDIKAATDKSVRVVIDGGNGGVIQVFVGDSSTANSTTLEKKLLQEIAATAAHETETDPADNTKITKGSIKLASKDRSTKKCTFVAKYNEARQAFEVKCSEDGTSTDAKLTTDVKWY